MNPGSTTDENGFVLKLHSDVLILPKGRDGKRWYYLRNGELDSANGVFKILSLNGAPFNGEIREENLWCVEGTVWCMTRDIEKGL